MRASLSMKAKEEEEKKRLRNRTEALERENERCKKEIEDWKEEAKTLKEKKEKRDRDDDNGKSSSNSNGNATTTTKEEKRKGGGGGGGGRRRRRRRRRKKKQKKRKTKAATNDDNNDDNDDVRNNPFHKEMMVKKAKEIENLTKMLKEADEAIQSVESFAKDMERKFTYSENEKKYFQEDLTQMKKEYGVLEKFTRERAARARWWRLQTRNASARNSSGVWRKRKGF